VGTGGEVRKTVTVVFCDVTGSTAMGERLDPETLRRVMSRYFDEMRAVLEKHGGTVEKFIGDAVMAVFGIPAVHEDDALRAVRAASEMRDRLRDLNKELERDHGVVIASRIGVNTGEVVAGGDDLPGASTLVTGDAVNVAARLEQAAEPGQILIGEPTHRLVRAAVTVEPVDALALKGKAESTPAFALVEVAAGAPGMERHLDAPIVGRVAELAALEEALDRVARDRRAALVTVMAPPGIGKSRLVDEFASIHEPDASVIEGRCLSYGDGITYWPVVEILTSAAGIADVDTPDDVRARILRLLDGAGEAPVIVERLSEFLGLSGATAAPEETHWAVRKLFEALASSRPLIVLIEDVHWAEPAMLDLIEHVVGWSADAPILMLCTARPELLEERPDWGAAADGTLTMTLEPLGPDESDELVANLIGGSALPPTAAVLVRAAEGNALFLEQLVGMLIDDGHLRRADGEWVASDDLSTVAIPSTITGILESRLDRLAPQERAVLERGSVEGRVFHWSSVTVLSDDVDPAETGGHLLALVRRGLIAPADALFGGGEAFRFRHALIRDAAYARMPKSTRSELHERHARWIEETAGDRIAEFEDVLAYHLEQATRLRSELGPVDETDRQLAARAVSALLSSAGRAAGRGDARAAVNLFGRALTLLPVDGPARPDVLVRYGEAVLDSGDPDRAAATFEEARALAGRLGDRRVALRARLHAADVRTITHPEDATEEELERVTAEAIPLFEDLGDDEGLAFAWKEAGQIALTKARGADMAAAFERAATHAERAGNQGLLSEVLAWLLASAVSGDVSPSEGLERIESIRARAPHDRKVDGLAAVHEAMALAELGRFDEAREAYRTAYGILADLGSRLWWAGTHFSSGWVEILADDLPAAERELRLGIDALASMGEHAYLSTQAAVLARVLYAQGRYEEAGDMADLGRRSGWPEDVATQVPATSVQAKLLARDGDIEAALELAGEAVEMTAESDFLEVRGQALEDLAEVHELAGRPDDAAAALRQAVELYERRGILPLIERTRARLQQLT
jgi:class 3 adenylate cyclase/tetratricopeptide (TPR) repeat protein